MSKKVSYYEVEPVITIINRDTLNDNSSEGLLAVLGHTVQEQGIEFVDGVGYTGLNDAMHENLSNIIPRTCERADGCLAEIEFDSRDMVAEVSSKITITCPGARFDKQDEADAFEAKERRSCGFCHERMAAGLVDWLEGIPRKEAKAEERIAELQGELVLARNGLNDVYRLKEN